MLQRVSIKITRLQFYLLLCFQSAKTLTDEQTDLGQTVTINCDFDVKEVYWLLLKLPRPPVVILRTFSPAPFYYNTKFKQKYSLLSKNHLFINNVTLEELGVYYCMTTDTKDRRFSNGTRLHLNEPTPGSPNNTVAESTEQISTKWLIIILVSGLLNAVLIIVVIGLLKVFVDVNKRTSGSAKRFQHHLRQPPDSTVQSLYDEVNFHTPCKNIQSNHDNSTYVLVQMPKSSTFGHK